VHEDEQLLGSLCLSGQTRDVVFGTQFPLFPEHSYLFASSLSSKEAKKPPSLEEISALTNTLNQTVFDLEGQIKECISTYRSQNPGQERDQSGEGKPDNHENGTALLEQSLAQLVLVCTLFNTTYQQEIRHWVPDKFTPVSGLALFFFFSSFSSFFPSFSSVLGCFSGFDSSTFLICCRSRRCELENDSDARRSGGVSKNTGNSSRGDEEGSVNTRPN